MRQTISIVSLIVLLGLVLRAQDFKLEEKEEIRKTLKFADVSGSRTFEIDNVFGSIEVTGSNGVDVELVAGKTIKAKSQEDLQKAKEEVRLVINQEKNDITVYVDGPFRCREHKRQTWREPGYQVQFNFKVKVPRKADLYLKTVTDGRIRVENVAGELEIRNVNGSVEMSDIVGPVKAQTVNGDVKVIFSRTPSLACSFKTINGKLDLFFPENLRADFRLKTFNGEVYSDFPVTHLPSPPATPKREDGKFIYKSNRFFGVQVGGKGGPEIKMDTFNGDIFINKRKV
jgi:DUF4097 and DUF4098 domain-containing protein YvlB